MSIKDGGQAFPQKVFQPLPGGGGNWSLEGGLSARDYFAAKAMQGLLALGSGLPFDIIAKDGYDLADAMLKAREGS